MSGVGKTQLALGFIQDNRKQYNPIFWIDAHTRETAQESFLLASKALGLMFNASSTAHLQLKNSPVVAGVLGWFAERDEGDRRWLVVVDNADDTSWNVEEIIPAGPHGHVIVTSKHPQASHFLGGQCARLSIDSMTLDEARTVLRKYMRADTYQITGIDHLCDKVVSGLGCLAFAVNLAGAYLAEQLQLLHHNANVEEAVTTVLTQYLADYELHQDELLQRKSPGSQETVWTVWDSSLTAIEESSPGSYAREVLAFLAQFDQGHVQEEMFRLTSVGWPEMMKLLQNPEDDRPSWLRKMVMCTGDVWDSFNYRQAVLPLIRYDLLQRGGHDWVGTTMHQLVRWRARKMYQENNEAWARWKWFFMIAGVCQINREKGRPEFRRHMIAHLTAMGESDFDLGQVMHLQGISLATLLMQLAELYHDDGRWAEAEKLYARCMDLRTIGLGPEHPDTLNSIANLALTYRDQGKWLKAEGLQTLVMKARERVLGADQPDTLTTMSDIVWTYYKLHRLDNAQDLGLHVLEKQIHVLGPDHPNTLISMAHLGAIHEGLGRSAEAEKWKAGVLEARIRVLGREHTDTLKSMVNLAHTYRRLGRFKEAENQEVAALEIRRRILGPEHPSTLISMNNLAWTLLNQGRHDEATLLMTKCISTSIRTLGRDHPSTKERLFYWVNGPWKSAKTTEWS